MSGQTPAATGHMAVVESLSCLQLREQALSRWDGEGGAGPDGPQEAGDLANAAAAIPELTNTELVQLRIRVIALENLLISILARSSDQQREAAREMAAHISPRPGFTPHPLTIHAAQQMTEIVDRAERFRLPVESEESIAVEPYRSTPVFDEHSLPAALRREHRTKPGVWGIIRVIEGRLRYHVMDPASEVTLEPGRPGLILPDVPHHVEPLGPVRMRVDFYDQLPVV